MNFKKLLHYGLGLVLMLGLIYLVETQLGWRKTFQPWLELPVSSLIVAVGLVFLSYWIRALRLYFQFPQALSNQQLVSLKLMLQHNLLNNLLPMRTGEVSFPLLMQRYFQIPTSTSVPTLFWFRLLDLLAILLFAALSLGFILWGLTTSIAISCLILIAFLASYQAQQPALKLLRTRLSEKHKPLIAKIENGLPKSYGDFLLTCFWTFLNWLLKLAAFCWVLTQFVDIDYLTALLGSIGGEITSVLPIHGIAGAGTYEAGVIAALSLVDAPIEQALMGAVNVHLFLLSCSLIGGLLSLLIPRPKI